MRLNNLTVAYFILSVLPHVHFINGLYFSLDLFKTIYSMRRALGAVVDGENPLRFEVEKEQILLCSTFPLV